MSSIGIVLVLEEARPVCELMISDGGVPKPRAGGEPDFAPSPETPGGYVGQAALQEASSISWQQAAPGNVSTRGSSIACRILTAWNQTRWVKHRAG